MSDLNRPLLRARTQAKSESGFSMIEALVSLFLLAMILSGVVAAASTFHGANNLDRVRQTANAIASNAVEQARALSFNDLKLNPNSIAANASYTDPDLPPGDTRNPFTVANTGIVVGALNCSTCIPYTYTKSDRGVTYTVTQMVLKMGSYNDSQGQPQTLKKLIVTVSYNFPKAGQTKVSTLLNNQDYVNPPILTGAHIEVHDDGCQDDPSNPGTPLPGTCGTSPGSIIDDGNLAWTVTIKDAGGNNVGGTPDQTDDGFWEKELPPGSYTCTITSYGLGGTLGYYKMGTTNNATPTSSFGCNGGAAGEQFAVVSGDTTNLISQWSPSSTCYLTGTNGNVAIFIHDGEGTAVAGAKVTFTDSTGHVFAAVTTATDGTASFQNKAGPYSYTVTKSGWYTINHSATDFCIYGASNTVPLDESMSDAPAAGTLTVNVKNNLKVAKDYTIQALNTTTGDSLSGSVGTVNPGKQGQRIFQQAPAGAYSVTACRVAPASPPGTVCDPIGGANSTKTGTLNDLGSLTLTVTDDG